MTEDSQVGRRGLGRFALVAGLGVGAAVSILALIGWRNAAAERSVGPSTIAGFRIPADSMVMAMLEGPNDDPQAQVTSLFTNEDVSTLRNIFSGVGTAEWRQCPGAAADRWTFASHDGKRMLKVGVGPSGAGAENKSWATMTGGDRVPADCR